MHVIYFVVHSPKSSLIKELERADPETQKLVRLWLPEDIARLTVNYGLVDWVLGKAK